MPCDGLVVSRGDPEDQMMSTSAPRAGIGLVGTLARWDPFEPATFHNLPGGGACGPAAVPVTGDLVAEGG